MQLDEAIICMSLAHSIADSPQIWTDMQGPSMVTQMSLTQKGVRSNANGSKQEMHRLLLLLHPLHHNICFTASVIIAHQGMVAPGKSLAAQHTVICYDQCSRARSCQPSQPSIVNYTY